MDKWINVFYNEKGVKENYRFPKILNNDNQKCRNHEHSSAYKKCSDIIMAAVIFNMKSVCIFLIITEFFHFFALECNFSGGQGVLL